MALLAYSFLQVALYGAFGPAAASLAAAHLGMHAPWWEWALGAWAVITVLGLLRVDITGKVLGALTAAEIVVIVAETVSGLSSPAGGHLSFATLSPSALTSAGFGTVGVLAVVAVLGFTGFEQAPVLAEEAKHPRRTIPVTTYLALGVIGVVYAGSGLGHGRPRRRGPCGGRRGRARSRRCCSGWAAARLSQAAQWLFLSSLFAATLAFHNCVWRYAFALGREGVLPGVLGRTGSNNIPKAASLAQSATGLAVIGAFALAGGQPMQDLFFDLGTTGGFGILLLYALTSVAVIAFFARNPAGRVRVGPPDRPGPGRHPADRHRGAGRPALRHAAGRRARVGRGVGAARRLRRGRRSPACAGGWSSRSAARRCTRPSGSAPTPSASRPRAGFGGRS